MNLTTRKDINEDKITEVTLTRKNINEDRITELNLTRKDINTRDMRIAIITTLTQIEPMEMAREDITIMKIKMKAMFKITMEDKEHKEVKERLPINLEIRLKILQGIKSDLEENRAITTTVSVRELLLSTARLRHWDQVPMVRTLSEK